MAYIGVSPSNGVRQKHTYTATANQTSFSGVGAENVTLSYRDSNYVDVYRNGVKLGDEDYTSTSGTAIVLAEGAAVNDIVEIIVYDVFSIADLNASNLNSGTVPDARFPSTLPAISGANLTNLDATDLTGTIASARVAGSYTGITGTGALNAGSITSGFGGINNGSSTITTTGVGSFGSLDISGDIDVDGTTNLDVVDIDGAVNMATTALVTGVLTTTAVPLFNGGIDLPTVNTYIKGGGHNVIQVDSTRTYLYGGTNGVQFRTADNASALVDITNAGNVGIGTSSPSSSWASANNFVISDTSSDGGMTILSSTSGNGNIMFSDAAAGAFSDARGLISYLHASDAMRFMTANSEAMRIDSSGNVGIGTSSPDAPLEIEGNVSSTTQFSGFGGLRIHNANGSAHGVTSEMYFTAGTGSSNRGAAIGSQFTSAASGNDLYFATNGGNVSSTNTLSERMRITSAGNVGIGTSSPQAELHVHDPAGHAKIRLSGVASDADTFEIYQGIVGVTNGGLTIRDVEASADRLVINSSGNVGIGTSSPTFAAGSGLQVKGSDFTSTRVTGGSSTGVDFAQASDGTAYAYNRDNMPLVFGTNDAERMRIDASGNVLVATTTAVGKFTVVGSNFGISGETTAGANGGVTYASKRTSNGIQMRFYQSSTVCGDITTNGSAVNYGSNSDYRLKENVVTDWDATTRLKQLKPSRFNFIADADTTVDGFLAHEVQSVVPEAITGTKDAVDADGNAVMQGIDQSKLVPLLVKTIQELEARITALEGA
jgi:hypothetical protein